MNYWFTGDTHFGHHNIMKYCNRPFDNVTEMNKKLIENVNQYVKPNDCLIHLGDWSFNKSGYTPSVFRNQINVKNIIFIIGNHDPKNKRGVPKNEFTSIFTECHFMLERKIFNQSIVFLHYAMLVWNKSHYGSWHLYGHSHGSLRDNPNSLSFDVGVDSIAKYLNKKTLLPENYRPISFDEIKHIMSAKKFEPVDHHKGKNE